MRKTLNRIGALALVLSMVVPMLTVGLAPAAAAGVGYTASDTGKPRLFIDFLGDNGDGAGNWTAVPGTPADTDQGPDGANVWSGYTTSNSQGWNAGLTQGTIFWVGVGLDQVDNFVLANQAGDTGVHSMELAFYYNSTYVEPYTGGDFAATLQSANTGANDKNHWSGDYTVQSAVPDADPNDLSTGLTVNDPDTQEFGPANLTGWDAKLVYVSLEKIGDGGAARFSGAATGGAAYTDTQYVMMIPFKLKQVDAVEKALCFKLARNGAVFTFGGGSTGASAYGAWERDTTRDPAHDLKLMLDFTGDLNIFTGNKETDTHDVTLTVNDGGSSGNTAALSITDDPAPDPPRIDGSAGNGTIYHVGERTGLTLQVKPGTGYKVDISMTDGGTGTYDPPGAPPIDLELQDVLADGTQIYTLFMPDTDLNITVEFTWDSSSVQNFKATLRLEDLEADGVTPGPAENKAVLSYAAQKAEQTGEYVQVPAGDTVELGTAMNTDYNAQITIQKPGSTNTVTYTVVTDTLGSGSYTFVMPSNDVDVTVKFVKADQHAAKLAVGYGDGVVKPADPVNEANTARLEYTDAASVVQATTDLWPGKVPDTALLPPETDTLTLRDQRVVTVATAADPGYRVAEVTVTEQDPPETPAAPRTVAVTQDTRDPSKYTFVMPKYPVDVRVVFEPVPTYKVRVAIDWEDALVPKDNTVTLTGTDARGAQTLDLADNTYGQPGVADSLFFFEDTELTLTTKCDKLAEKCGMSLKIEVRAGDGSLLDTINYSGSQAAGYTFRVKKLAESTDEILVSLTFKNQQDETHKAKLYVADNGGHAGNRAYWVTADNSQPTEVEAAQDERLTGKLLVEPGYYIESVVTLTDTRAIPAALSGNGWNNGKGGEVDLTLVMPAGEDVVSTIVYKQGPPPVEQAFTATLLVEESYVSVAPAPAHQLALKGKGAAATASGDAIAAYTGETLTGAFQAAAGYYIERITVTADVGGVPVSWSYAAPATPGDTAIQIAMPPANIAVTVTFAKADIPAPDYSISLNKTEQRASDINTVTTVVATPPGTPFPVSGPIAAAPGVTSGGTAPLGAKVALSIAVDSFSHVEAVTVLDAAGTAYPVTYENADKTGAVFYMPGGPVTATVHYKDGPAPTDPVAVTWPLILAVSDPANDGAAHNTAQLLINGTPAGTADKDGVLFATAKPGDVIEVAWTADTGFTGGPAAVTPADLGIFPVPVTTGSARFTMPAAAATVTVPFAKTGLSYTANLILRGPDGMPFTIDGRSGFTTVDGVAVAAGQAFSVTAAPGQEIALDVFANGGYYIKDITVTPAALGTDARFTGSLAQQAGWFTMPAANVTVNVTFGTGWPDQVYYGASLKVLSSDGSAASATMSVLGPDPNDPGSLLERVSVTAGQGETKNLAVQEKETVKVTLAPPAGNYAAQITVLDSVGKRLPYAWVKAGGTDPEQISLPMPACNMTVEIKYVANVPPPGVVTLRVSGSTANTTARTLNFDTGVSASVDGRDGIATVTGTVGNYFTVEVHSDPGTYIDAVLVMAGGELIALNPFFKLADAHIGDFTMPDVDVDIYVVFKPKPVDTLPEAYAAAITVTGENGADGTATLSLISGPPAAGIALLAAAPMDQVDTDVAGGTKYLVAEAGSSIQVEVAAKDPNDKVRDIRLTPIGSTLSESVPFEWLSDTAVAFTMPAQPVAVETLLVRETPPTYRAQVVVRQEAGGGPGAGVNNDAWLSNGGAPGRILTGLPLGDVVNLGIQVDPGYKVASVLMVPQGSTPDLMPGTPNAASTQSFRMPAGDVVVYVDFTVDTSTKHKANLHVLGVDDAVTDAVLTWSESKTDWRNGPSFLEVPAGGEVEVSAAPSAGLYLKAAYILSEGEVLPLQFPGLPGLTPPIAPQAQTFEMPESDVDVYVEFSATPPVGYAAVLTVTGPTPADPDVIPGTATMTVDGSDPARSVTVESKDDVQAAHAAHGYLDVKDGDTLTVTITVTQGYAVDQVIGSPDGTVVLTQPDGEKKPNEYQFTMPASNVGVHVVLKEAVGNTVTLHVAHGEGTTLENAANWAQISYTDGDGTEQAKSVTAQQKAGKLEGLPAGQVTAVTLAVKPEPGYFVDAAYAVADGKLLPLSKVLERTDNAAGLAGATATFQVKDTDVDVYVFYKDAKLADGLYNAVFIVTDLDREGKTLNSGKSKAGIESTPGLTPAEERVSDGAQTFYRALKENDPILVEAIPGGGFQCLEVLSSAAQGVPPTVTQRAAPNDKQYDVTMPASNLGVKVTFRQNGYNATLKVDSGVDPALANQVTMTATVDTHAVKLLWDNVNGPSKTIDGLPPTETPPKADVMTQMAGDESLKIVSALTAPSVLSAVLSTTSAGTSFVPVDTGDHTYGMSYQDVTITAVLTDWTDTTYTAAARWDTSALTAQSGDNAVTGVSNVTDAAMHSGPIWANGRPAEEMTVSFTTAAGVYAKVTAVRTDNGAPIPVVQLGVTGTGEAHFFMPDSNVQVTVTYTDTNPFPDAPLDLKIQFPDDGTGKLPANAATLDNSPIVQPGSSLTIKGDDIQNSDTFLQKTFDGTTAVVIPAGGKLNLSTEHAIGWHVDAVQITIYTDDGSGGIIPTTLTLSLKADGTLQLPMPAQTDAMSNALLSVIFAPGELTPRPYDPDNIGDYTCSPPLETGYLKAVKNETDPTLADITVPVLFVGMVGDPGAETPEYHDVYHDAVTTPDNEAPEFQVDFLFYVYDDEKADYILLDDTDYTLGAITNGTSSVGGAPYTNAEFSFTPLDTSTHALVKDLLTKGGTLYVSARRQETGTAPDVVTYLESGKTQLLFPGPDKGPRPYDPDGISTTDPAITWIGSENWADYLVVTVPALAVLDQDGSPAYEHVFVAGDDTASPAIPDLSTTFQFYVDLGGPDGPVLLEPGVDVEISPLDAAAVPIPGADYSLDTNRTFDDPDDPGVTYTAARMKLTPLPISAPDPAPVALSLADDSYTTAYALSTLAAGSYSPQAQKLMDIINNAGSSGAQLFITATRTETDAKESEQIQIVAPQYDTVNGTVISYAPTHPFTVTLTSKDPNGRSFAVESTPVAGTGLWSQEFQLRTSELFGAGTRAYTLSVEKASHVTYTWDGLSVTDAAPGSAYALREDITLIAGDIDGDGRNKISDRAILTDYMSGSQPWNSDPPDAVVNPGGSTLDPDSWAYLCDLNGDGVITVADLAVLTDPANYGKTAKDYDTSAQDLKLVPAAPVSLMSLRLDGAADTPPLLLETPPANNALPPESGEPPEEEPLPPEDAERPPVDEELPPEDGEIPPGDGEVSPPDVETPPQVEIPPEKDPAAPPPPPPTPPANGGQNADPPPPPTGGGSGDPPPKDDENGGEEAEAEPN